MTSALTTQSAEIRTASVEIKTLTVSGKQVTLAVFRQLVESPLLAKDGTLSGEPWGIVNYHVPRSCPSDVHFHVVWQSGSDLRRSSVSRPDLARLWIPADDLMTASLAAADNVIGVNRYGNPGLTIPEEWTNRRSNGIDAAKFRWQPTEYPDVYFYVNREPSYREVMEVMGDSREDAEALLEQVTCDLMEYTAAAIAERRRRIQAWRQIEDLPQLFIAV